MKIGIVSNLYPPQARGGAELVAERIVDGLYERGHEVFVLTTQPFEGIRSLFPRIRERHLEAVYRFFPLNVYYVRNDRHVFFPVRILWHAFDLVNPFARLAMRAVIRDEDPDVVITHNLKGLGVAVAREIQRLGIVHVHTLHDVQLSVPSGLLIHGQERGWMNRSIPRRIYEFFARRAIGRPDAVLSPSKFLADFYRKRKFFLDIPVHVVPNPLPTMHTLAPRSKGEGPVRFLFAGQLEEHKGLLLMMAALKEMDASVELHIAGDGALAHRIQERARTDPRIRYHGFIPLEHLMHILQLADAVLIPSICYENSPTVIYEAFQAGVPVIASRIGGIPELITPQKTGLLVEPQSVPALVEAMREIIRDRDLWRSRAREIQSEAQNYSTEVYLTRLEEIIREIQEGKNRI